MQSDLAALAGPVARVDAAAQVPVIDEGMMFVDSRATAPVLSAIPLVPSVVLSVPTELDTIPQAVRTLMDNELIFRAPLRVLSPWLSHTMSNFFLSHTVKILTHL